MQPPVTQKHRLGHKLKQGVGHTGTLILKAGHITDSTVPALELNTLLRIPHPFHKGIKIYSNQKLYSTIISL